MKRFLCLFFVLVISGSVVSAGETGIQLYVRVVDDATFVRGLKAADFEVTIGGTPQQAAALYQIDGSKIVQKEGKMKLAGKLARHFTLVFFMKNYYPQLDSGIEQFFNQTLLPGDSLTIITPKKSYNLKEEVLQKRPKQQLAQQLKALLQRDIKLGASEYKSMISTLENTIKENTSITITALTRYEDYLNNLEVLRNNDQNRIMSILKQQNQIEKIKGIFILYERELKPNYNVRTLGRAKADLQEQIDIQAKLTSLFEVYTRDVRFNVKKLSQEFSSQETILHFVSFRNQFDNRSDVNMNDQSEDIFGLFNPLAMATGGMVESTGNPAAMFKKELTFFRYYYIVDIPAVAGAKKGKLNKIKIKIKGKDNYKVHHISGIK